MTSTDKDTKPEIWGLAEVAEYLDGIQRTSVRRYYKRGDIPQPDGFLDEDKPWWLANTIRNHKRPGRLSGLKNQP